MTYSSAPLRQNKTMALGHGAAAFIRQHNNKNAISSLQTYINTPEQFDERVMAILMNPILNAASQFGAVDVVRYIEQHFSSFLKDTHKIDGLILSAYHNQPKCFDAFWDFDFVLNTSNYNSILEHAADGGSIHIVNKVLPHAQPKYRSSAALRGAAKHGHHDVFDLLYPLSSPETALKFLNKRKNTTIEEKKWIEERLQAEGDKKIIHRAIDQTAKPSRKAKI